MREKAQEQVDTMKEIQNVIQFPVKSPVMPKEHKGFSFGKVVDFVKRGFRI